MFPIFEKLASFEFKLSELNTSFKVKEFLTNIILKKMYFKITFLIPDNINYYVYYK